MKYKKIKTITLSLVLCSTIIMGSFAEVLKQESPIISNLSVDLSDIDISQDSFENQISSIEDKGFKEENLSTDENILLDKLVEISIENTKDLENTVENREMVKMLLRDDTRVTEDYDNMLLLYSASNKRKPKARVSVKTAAAVFNVIVNGILIAATGGGGAAGARLLIKKLGKKGAQNYMKRTLASKLKTKLLKWGLTGSAAKIGSKIGDFVYNLIDPGTAIARYLDKTDGYGYNGYIEI